MITKASSAQRTLERETRRLAAQKVRYVNDDLIANLLLIPGIPLDGAELETELLVRLTRQTVGDRRFYVVRSWMLFDVMLSDSQLTHLERDGGCATILYASELAYDSNTGGALPGAIRTGYQRSFSDFYFETNSAVFVLAGPGSRKHASVPALVALDAA